MLGNNLNMKADDKVMEPGHDRSMNPDKWGPDVRRPAQVLKFLIRVLGVVVLLALGLFCLFGFLASFEPGNGWEWKAIYGALFCASFGGAANLVRRGNKKATRRGGMNQ